MNDVGLWLVDDCRPFGLTIYGVRMVNAVEEPTPISHYFSCTISVTFVFTYECIYFSDNTTTK